MLFVQNSQHFWEVAFKLKVNMFSCYCSKHSLVLFKGLQVLGASFTAQIKLCH